MAKRKISGIISASEHPMDLTTQWNQQQTDGTYHAYDGDDIEAFLKKELGARPEPTDEVAIGETKPPTSGAVFDTLVGTVTDVDVRDSEDGTQYVMTVTQKDEKGGETPKEVRFSKYSDDDKVVVNIDLTDSGGASVPDQQYLPAGSGLVLKYAVGVSTVGGSEVGGYTDLKARVIMKRGATVIGDFQNAGFTGVAAGQSYLFDASEWLTDATTYTVQVEAQAMYQGSLISRTATVRVTMVAMQMDTTFSVANGTADGGYRNDVNIPFTVKGTTGEKNIYYRLNGGTPYTLPLSSGSGLQSKNVTVALSEMPAGLNVLEAYALHEGSGVMSRVHYLTLLKAGSAVRSYAGLMFSHRADGFQASYRQPVLEAEQFTAWSFDYTAYDASDNTATLSISRDGAVLKEDRLPRGTRGSYGETNVSVEQKSYTLTCGESVITLGIHMNSHPDIEASLAADAVCSFEAFGRSNTESSKDTWESGGKRMEFHDVLWSVNENGAGSGWHNDRLLLSNGAGMTLTADGGYRPFNDADKPVGFGIKDVGMTIEIEYSTDNVTDTDAELITCLGTLSNGNRYGLVVTAEEAKFLTGVVTEAVDAGQVIRYEDSVGTKFGPGENIKITYVFYPDVKTNEQRTLIGFYVNGAESAASRWKDKVSFDILSQLEFNSVGADLSVKNIRIYNKALTNDEVLNNYIVDRGHLEDTEDEKGVRTLDEDNRVLNEGDTVSMEKLMGLMQKRKNSILVMYGTGSVESEVPGDSDTMNVVDALAQLNDKKANKLVREIRFYNGEDRSLDFILRNVYVRIQGTSSVNYARKNFRFYFQKTASGWTVTLDYGEIDANGNQSSPVHTEGKKNLFKLRRNSVGAKLACPKCDFSDSSMTTNTGGAKFINDGLKEMGLLTPAQRYAQDHPDTCKEDIRSAIDGMPCDLFVAKEIGDDLVYYGQYNMNNEKSDSYPIFGQDDEIGGVEWGTGDTAGYLEADTEGALGTAGAKNYLPVCFETLNNSNPCCLFQWVPSTDPNHVDFMDSNFDGGLEFNHPKDTFWADGGGDADEEPNLKDHLGTGDKYDKMYKATDRMMSFIYRCIKETPAGKNLAYDTSTHSFTGMDYEDAGGKFPKEKWVSGTFAKDAHKYFDVAYLLAYYLYVDFNLGVDQLAKNMLIRTWDGVKWYITYYDGDCQHGNDNKSFLTGKYNDNRQTKRDGAYVMQGHNSWLWNLLLANFGDLMEQIMVSGYDGGASFMSAFSVQKAHDHFDKEQMQKWCERLYSKSGLFKYIYPFLNPMKVGADGAEQTYPQIYGLKGALELHRNYFIRRRYDLKQVEYGYVSTLGAQFYQSTASLEAGYTLETLQYMLTIPYRVQVSTSNGVQADSGLVDADVLHSLDLVKPFGENDPLKIIGAQRVKELVWHEDSFAIGFNFGLFTSLVKLDMSVGSPGGYRNGSFMTSTSSMQLLEELNMRNNLLARNGDNGNVAVLDLGSQSRLRKADLRGTGLARFRLATGAPVVELKLPATLEELDLQYLPKLGDGGLTLEGVGKIMGYRFRNCPGIDGVALLDRLHQAKQSGQGKLERFELYVDMEATADLLEKYYDYKTYTTAGEYDNAHSGLKGTVRLDKFLEEEDQERYRAKYPELEMIYPEYSMIEYDDSVSDDANVSNLDNRTGYKYGNPYKMSGHFAVVCKLRHRVLAKVTKMPTVLNVNIGNIDTLMNDTDGEATYYPLHDKDSYYYADAAAVNDCTPAKLDGTEGDVMMIEPHKWKKGINDYLNKKHYTCCSSNEQCPATPDATVISFDELSAEKRVRKGYKLIQGRNTLEDSHSADNNYSVCNISVQGFKRVRFPSVQPVAMMLQAIFCDADGSMLKTISLNSLDNGLEDGMYLIADIPGGAATLYFTTRNDAEFDKVVLSNSDKIEDMEPEWVEEQEHLCAVVGSTVVDGKLRSCVTGGSTTASMSWQDFHYYSQQRGMQQIDPMMHWNIANLFYEKYGRRDCQMECGFGFQSNARITGETAPYGMEDTWGYEKAKAVKPDLKPDYIDEGRVIQYAWRPDEESDGTPTVKQVKSICCMGYEDIYGHKYDMMDRVDVPNSSGKLYRWRVWMPDGSIVWFKGASVSNLYIGAVVHGKHMAVLMAGNKTASSNTHYCDVYYISGSAGRVVYRGYYSAGAQGGVACAIAYHDVSHSSASIGSRLAFRGKIVKAQSVAAYKAADEVA